MIVEFYLRGRKDSIVRSAVGLRNYEHMTEVTIAVEG
jgi:hypothetical protein